MWRSPVLHTWAMSLHHRTWFNTPSICSLLNPSSSAAAADSREQRARVGVSERQSAQATLLMTFILYIYSFGRRCYPSWAEQTKVAQDPNSGSWVRLKLTTFLLVVQSPSLRVTIVLMKKSYTQKITCLILVREDNDLETRTNQTSQIIQVEFF